MYMLHYTLSHENHSYEQTILIATVLCAGKSVKLQLLSLLLFIVTIINIIITIVVIGETSTPEQAELVHNFLYSGGKISFYN